MNVVLRIFAVMACSLGGMSVLADARLDDVRAKIDELFPHIEGEEVSHAPMPGWVEIQKGSIVAYMSTDGRYLLQGDLIDLEQQINLSEASRNQARRRLLADVTDDQVIAFTPQDVRHTVTIFTDVDCGYCRRMHSQIDDYMASGIEIRYLLYPRNGPTSPSWNVSEDVWCASDRNRALTAAKLDRDFETHTCDASAVTRHFSLGQDVGLTGTPAIVFEDGSLLSGWLSPHQLRERLDEMFPPQ